jgi:hypothetical protein
MPDRPADSHAVEAEAYLSSGPSSDTDINLVLDQLPAVTPEAAARFGAPPGDAFTIAPALVQPTSRGAVRLASNNVSGCRRDRWQLSRHGSRFCGHRARHRSRA